ncbi:MAG: hypothetical protein JO323_10550 [Acidobacteriia bacterium]|nr:hypothetical protein [Terriglobia bacterium]
MEVAKLRSVRHALNVPRARAGAGPYLLCLGMAFSPLLCAQSSTTSGRFIVERPTLTSLGFEWRIAGDENRNAAVEMTYRRKDEQQWHNAMPLLRLNGEVTAGGGAQAQPGAPAAAPDPNDPAKLSVTYVAPNMFAGSIFNLQPDTDYECRLVLSDPDGVTGDKEKSVTVHTRKEPVPAAGGNVYNVYPPDWTGRRTSPYYIGLMAAYYYAAPNIDWQNAYPPRVKPGDVILMHAGTYVADRLHYMNGQPQPGHLSLGTLFDGTYYLTAKGTAEKPIVIKSAGDGEVIIDGDGAQVLFEVMAADYNYFEGITFRNANVGFLLGRKNEMGETGFTLKHSLIKDMGRAVQDDWSGSKDFYIADNVFIGRHEPEKMMSWSNSFWAQFPEYPEIVGGSLGSEYAVKVYGQGHVVAYNYFGAWHDGVDIATYGVPDGTPDEDPDRTAVSIDFYNNDFYNMGDNCIESDGGAHNIRVFRNRCFNAPGGSLSAQPVWGGPVYFIQNIGYNTPTFGTCKFSPVSGIYVLQNTFVGECRGGPMGNAHFLNNLFLAQGVYSAGGGRGGAPGVGRGMPVLAVTTYTNYSTSDYNGFRPNPGFDDAFEWNSPAFEVRADFTGRLQTRHFKTLQAYSEATGQEKHSVLADFGTFVNLTLPNDPDPRHVYKPEDYDFRLKPASVAIDKGTVIPTITDGFTGKAPDLGAIEFGTPVPRYGPRTPVVGVQQYGSAFRAYTGPPPEGNTPAAK